MHCGGITFSGGHMVKAAIETDDKDDELSESSIPIQVGGRQYFIKSDSRQWMCGEYKQVQYKGKTVDRFFGKWHCSSLAGLFSILVEKKLRLSDYNSITDLQKNLEKIREEMQGMYDVEIVKAKGYRP